MSDAFVGEIRMFGGNFAPRGWAFCDGQLLPISQNTALFSLLGTNFGGNGVQTFGLPNLQGQVPLHAAGGQGPGLSERIIGESGGEASVTVLQGQMPSHTHGVSVSTAAATSRNPTGNVPATSDHFAYGTGASSALASAAIAVSGGSHPHNNLQPYITVSFIIALQGIFPPRS